MMQKNLNYIRFLLKSFLAKLELCVPITIVRNQNLFLTTLIIKTLLNFYSRTFFLFAIRMKQE